VFRDRPVEDRILLFRDRKLTGGKPAELVPSKADTRPYGRKLPSVQPSTKIAAPYRGKNPE